MKMNIIFSMGNEISNIFSSNHFFEESNIFRENAGKKMCGGQEQFLGEGVILCQKRI